MSYLVCLTQIDVVHEALRMARKIPAHVVHKSTMKYILDDYKKNRDKYTDADRIRIKALIDAG